MKTFRAKSGPFRERPYFTVQEVESICEDTLRKVDLFPASPEPIRIDRLIEKHFNVTPTYEDLADGVYSFEEIIELFSKRRLEEQGLL